MNTEAVEPQYTVRDKNAYKGSRTHEIELSDGKLESFTFPSERSFIPVPLAAALKFAKIDGFEVKDPTGQIVVPQQIEEQTNLGETISLAADQVIANLSELKKDALLIRANSPEAGGKFKANASVEELIKFLTELNLKTANAQGGSFDDDDDADELDITEEGGV